MQNCICVCIFIDTFMYLHVYIYIYIYIRSILFTSINSFVHYLLALITDALSKFIAHGNACSREIGRCLSAFTDAVILDEVCRCIYVNIWMCINMNIHIYMYIYMSIYICIYICIYISYACIWTDVCLRLQMQWFSMRFVYIYMLIYGCV
jgi:hypothetical protein